ncbi:ComEA family DNA-binding protein [Streptomyces canus]|uniref:ComEA family DNA-binding protein n=1 Tax=Streptomyces canus TaxID=58343 RepID=UPI0033DBD0FA
MGDGGSAEGVRWDGGFAERVRPDRGSVEEGRWGGGVAEDGWRGGGAAEESRRGGNSAEGVRWDGGFAERVRPDRGAAEDGRRDGRVGEEGRRGGGSPQGARWDRGSAEGVRPDDGLREEGRLDADRSSGGWRDTDDGSGDWRERVGLALRERMPVWLQTRCGLERRNVVALSVLLVVAAVFALQHFWTGRTQSVQAPEVVRAVAPFGQSGVGGRRAAAGAARPGGVSNTAGAPGAEIVVDVGGKVREPGIQRLPSGSRVADALKAAGGVRPGTNTDTLNRARFLVDGEQVIVGGPPAPAPAAAPGGSVTGGPAGTAAAPVSLNTATVDQLDTLPGVGPVLAQHIVDYRTRHGGFRSVDELREVNGIGDRRFADLRNLVRP